MEPDGFGGFCVVGFFWGVIGVGDDFGVFSDGGFFCGAGDGVLVRAGDGARDFFGFGLGDADGLGIREGLTVRAGFIACGLGVELDEDVAV